MGLFFLFFASASKLLILVPKVAKQYMTNPSSSLGLKLDPNLSLGVFFFSTSASKLSLVPKVAQQHMTNPSSRSSSTLGSI
jgi:hypothetical protein